MYIESKKTLLVFKKYNIYEKQKQITRRNGRIRCLQAICRQSQLQTHRHKTWHDTTLLTTLQFQSLAFKSHFRISFYFIEYIYTTYAFLFDLSFLSSLKFYSKLKLVFNVCAHSLDWTRVVTITKSTTTNYSTILETHETISS